MLERTTPRAGAPCGELIEEQPGDVQHAEALLHDLGKTRIPIEVLNKPGKLTDEERAVMQGHTIEGARIILESDRELDLAAAVA